MGEQTLPSNEQKWKILSSRWDYAYAARVREYAHAHIAGKCTLIVWNTMTMYAYAKYLKS